MVKRKRVVKKRASTLRPYNAGTMSESELRSFIISALRKSSTYWKPKNIAISRARIRRGVYKCENCGKEGPANLPPLPGRKRKRKNIQADHILPVVPIEGFNFVGLKDFASGLDEWCRRCFIEAEGYQAICWECHTNITKEENLKRKQYKDGR